MPACSFCSKHFGSHNALQIHKRKCEPSIVVTYANQTAVVHKEKRGYCCYCASQSCPKYFATTKGLIQHAEKTGMNWIGPDKVCSIKTLYTHKIIILQKTSTSSTPLQPNSSDSWHLESHDPIIILEVSFF